MKKMKKVMALLLSLVMVLAMSVVAFAEEAGSSAAATSGTYTITAPNNGHTYEVYQIFKGALNNVDGQQILSDLKWGISGTGTEGAVVEADVLQDIEGVIGDDTAKLAVITKYIKKDSTTGKILTTAKFGEVTFATPLQNVPAGYYLIKDVDGAFKDQYDSYTKYIVEIVDNVEISPKADKPSVEKKVKENKKYTGEGTDETYGSQYNDTADYSIGDAVPFKLIGTVPDMSQYKTYKYTFHDTLSKAFNAPTVADVKVYVADNKAGNGKIEVTSGFITTVDANTITVSTTDLKKIEYNKGSEKAVGVSVGQYIIVEYTAVLNANARIEKETFEDRTGNINKVYLTYSNNPNQSGDGESEEGKTPEDKVIVFTYKLSAEKIDGKTNAKLSGVTFKLYRLENDAKIWAKVTNGKLSAWTDDEKQATGLTSDAEGKFSVAGLDDGQYFIKEVKALPGYNTIDDTEVTISANTSNSQGGNGDVTELAEINLVSGGKTGTVVTITNNKGSNLPSTGGMGTTIFYVVGSILVLGAAILLITKKRMSAR